MEVKFRLMERDDLEEVINLCNVCFDEETSLEHAQRIFDEEADLSRQIYVVGEMNGEIVAHALLNIVPTIYENMNIYAILNHVCVKPEYRRSGIGMKLLDYCFEIAKDNHCRTVELWSKNFRIAAHGLYHKYGFDVLEAAFFEKEVK